MFFSYHLFKRKGFSGEKFWQYWSREGDFLLQVLSVLEGWHQRTAERLPRDFQAFEENSLEQRVLYELSGDACGSCGYLFRGSCGYNTAAVRSAARTHIYNIVGIADNI